MESSDSDQKTSKIFADVVKGNQRVVHKSIINGFFVHDGDGLALTNIKQKICDLKQI